MVIEKNFIFSFQYDQAYGFNCKHSFSSDIPVHSVIHAVKNGFQCGSFVRYNSSYYNSEVWRHLTSSSKSCRTFNENIHNTGLQCCYIVSFASGRHVKPRCTLATKLNSTRSNLLKLDCCRNRQQSRLLPIRSPL